MELTGPIAPAPVVSRDADLERLASVVGQNLPSGTDLVAAYPRCPRFYSRRVIEKSTNLLNKAVDDPVLVYLKGEVIGVGVSDFLERYAILAAARSSGGQWPVLVFRVLPTANRPQKFLDALATRLKIRLSTSDLRLRDASTIAAQLLAALATLRVRVIVIDHVHHVGEVAMAILAELITLSHGPFHTGPPLSVVLASPLDPRSALPPEIGVRLDLIPVVFPVYEPEDIAAVLPQLDLVDARFDPNESESADLVDAVYEATQGHVARLNPLFRCMLAIRPPGEPAGAELVAYAARFTAGITRLIAEEFLGPDPECEPEIVHRLDVLAPARKQPSGSKAKSKGSQSPSLEKVKKRRNATARAESVRRDLTHTKPSRKRR